MSAILDKLLKGQNVEWFQLGQVAEYSKSRISYDKVDEENYVGVDNLLPNQAGKTNSNYLPKSGTLIEYIPNDILIGNIRPYLKKIWHSDRSGGTNGDVLVIRSIYNELNPRYLYQVLSDNSFFNYNVQNSKGAKMPRGDKEAILKYLIPIPPLDVQAEIVRILDAFTAITAELTAELNMREKQYQYYRDKLLTFSDNEIIWKSLGDVCSLGVGQAPTSNEEGKFIFMNAGTTPASYLSIYNTEGDTITTPSRGQGGIGFVAYQNDKFWCGPLCYRIKSIDKSVMTKYLYYYLSKNSMQIIALANMVGVPALNRKELITLKLPIPPLDEQKRIVEILDKFETLTHSITEGLPKEIALRQRQYEYYREQLLDFPKD